MNTNQITPSLAMLFAEIVDGPPTTEAYVLNQGDPGLLRSLDRLGTRAVHPAANFPGS